MRFKRLIIVLLSVVLLPVGPAFAEPEPDNWIWQATGPITSGSISGTIASDNDVDWHMFYAASQTQLIITIPTTTCGAGLDVYLMDTNGDDLSWAEGSTRSPQTITYTTPIGTQRFFLAVDGPCSAYTVNLAPVTSLLTGPALPSLTVPTGEPNESADQAWGLLTGDTIYTGIQETSNDKDWFSFYANAAFAITATPSTNCSGDIALYDESREEVGWAETAVNHYRSITYTPTTWQRFFLDADSDCVNGAYRFWISPASAIQTGPQPTPPPPPGPMTGLSKRKTKSTVVVFWPAIPGASSYAYRTIRGKRYGGWVGTGNTWASFKKKRLPRKARLRVEVQPVNAAGAGAPQTIKIKR